MDVLWMKIFDARWTCAMCVSVHVNLAMNIFTIYYYIGWSREYIISPQMKATTAATTFDGIMRE